MSEKRPMVHTQLTPEKVNEFLDVLRNSGNVSHSCQTVGLSRNIVYLRRKADPEFALAWDDAYNEAIDLLIEEGWRRAKNGTSKPVFHQGEVCGHIQEYSDSLLMFLVKGKRSEYATERKQVSGPDGGPIETRSTVINVITQIPEPLPPPQDPSPEKAE